MDSYAMHLAVAALFGASVVAVSAYCMHRKTLAQLLEFAKSIENRDRGEEEAKDDSPRRKSRGQAGGGRKKTMASYRRVSASLPDVTAISDANGGVEEKRNGPVLSVEGSHGY